jgi:lipoprotein NlpI
MKCCWMSFVLLLAPPVLFAGTADETFERALAAARAARFDEAAALCNDAIRADRKLSKAYMLRAQIEEHGGKYAESAATYTQLLTEFPEEKGLYQHRGTAYFRAGKIKEACADFDLYNEAFPGNAPKNWQRGIALYYAGRFEDGRKQFELHKTVNPDDVENAAWHFLCNARANGVERARKELIPVEGDPRVPMKEIQQMFAGTLLPAGVLAAAQANAPGAAEKQRREFYAHLYIGLYHEACGEAARAREHLELAAKGYGRTDYMAEVARVHVLLLKEHAVGK